MAGARRTLDGIHTVLTPEYVEFNFVIAGLYSRFLAWLVDALIVSLFTIATLTVLSFALAVFPGFLSALSFILYFLLDWGYAITLEVAWSGQTVGKRLLGLRVIQDSGVRVGFYQAALRNLARPLDRLPVLYLVGGICALLSHSHQRLGDLLAGTLVIRERRLKIPSSIARPPTEAQLLQDLLFLSRVRRISAEERELIFSAAMRREELGMEARLALFAALARRLEEELNLDKPAHLSDEKLVLLVAAALAEKARSEIRDAQVLSREVSNTPSPRA
jgi:uncharacterized RDD family membrane protein YckC